MEQIHKIRCEELENILDSSNVMIIDIRSKEAYQAGHIEHAVLIDSEQLELKSAEAVRQYIDTRQIQLQNKKIVVYCESGGRSVYFAGYLQGCGYRAWSLAGGYRAYRKYTLQKFKYI